MGYSQSKHGEESPEGEAAGAYPSVTELSALIAEDGLLAAAEIEQRVTLPESQKICSHTHTLIINR